MTDLDRIASLFDRFNLSSSEPAWSSWMLRRFVAEVVADPDIALIDLIRGLDLALGRRHIGLTETVANFIRDLSVIGCELDRGWWDRADWSWVERDPMREMGAARAYLLLRNLPPSATTPFLLTSMIHALRGSCRRDEATATLADDPDTVAAQPRLKENRETHDDLRSSAAPHARGNHESNVVVYGEGS